MSAKPTTTPAVPTLAAAAPESPLEKFLDRNFSKIIALVLLIAAAVVIVGILRHRSAEAATNAAVAATRASTPEDCDVVVAAHPGSTAAGNSLLKKANLLWDQNKKDSSLAVLREFTGSFSDHPFRLQGMASLATRLQEMGTLDEAKKLFEQIITDNPTHDLAGLSQLRVGDILWQQGKEAEAKKYYEELPRKFPGSPFFEENASRLEWIGAGLPTKEVEPPKPPPASIAAPAATPPAAPAGDKLIPALPQMPAVPPTATVTPSGSAATQPIEVKATPAPAPTPPPAATTPAPAAPAKPAVEAPKPADPAAKPK